MGARESRTPDARRHHIGEDRRAAPPSRRATDRGLLGLTVAVLVIVWIILQVARLTDRPITRDLDWSTLAYLLASATLSIAGVVAALAIVRRRLGGTTESVYLGAAALWLGVLAVAVAHLPTHRTTAGGLALVEGLEPSVRLVAGLILVAAAVTAEIDTRVTFPRVLGAALVVTAASVTVLSFLEPAGAAMGSWTGELVVSGVWGGAAIAHLVTARRRGRRANWVIAATAAVLFLAALARVLGPMDEPSTAATATLFVLFAFLILLGQGLRGVEWAFCQQRARLLDIEAAVHAVTTLRHVEQQHNEERTHDAKSALLAIEAAATALERHRDQLDVGTRGQLGEAMTVEIARLYRLIAADAQDDESASYSLAEVLAPLVATERVRGTRIDLRVPGALVSRGRWSDTAEVFRNVFDNARRYAPGSPITISAEIDGDWILVHVDDHGPGIERTERAQVFERGARGSSSAGTNGDGLGLHVSRRLVRDQGGDLWVEPRPGGGARFAFCIPLGSRQRGRQDDVPPAIAQSLAGLRSGGSDE